VVGADGDLEVGLEAEGPVVAVDTSLAASEETPDVVPEGLVSSDEEQAVEISEKPIDSPDVLAPAEDDKSEEAE
jgi:hypothetical protein